MTVMCTCGINVQSSFDVDDFVILAHSSRVCSLRSVSRLGWCEDTNAHIVYRESETMLDNSG
jgi:hypothetical protein